MSNSGTENPGLQLAQVLEGIERVARRPDPRKLVADFIANLTKSKERGPACERSLPTWGKEKLHVLLLSVSSPRVPVEPITLPEQKESAGKPDPNADGVCAGPFRFRTRDHTIQFPNKRALKVPPDYQLLVVGLHGVQGGKPAQITPPGLTCEFVAGMQLFAIERRKNPLEAIENSRQIVMTKLSRLTTGVKVKLSQQLARSFRRWLRGHGIAPDAFIRFDRKHRVYRLGGGWPDDLTRVIEPKTARVRRAAESFYED